MPAPSVALLQNQFRLSGRTKVACEVIQLLNELGVVPDVLTFTPAAIGRHVGRFYGLENLRFEYRRVAPVALSRGMLWQVLAINWLTRARHSRYAMVFNSNNVLQGLNPAGRYLHYVYYPIPLDDADLVQSGQESLLRRLYTRIRTWLMVHSGKASLDDGIYTISEFSRKAIHRKHPESVGRVRIIYPPSYSGGVVCSTERVLRCVSVGSILPDKRQMEQLVVASKLPELEFWIVGSVRSRSYYRACRDYVQREGLSNVRFETDMSFDDLQRLLNRSMFFLHAKRGEPFGMSTVQAIAAGCIPVAHDSGGQREVVPFEELRFTSTDGAAHILRNLLETSPGGMPEVRQALQQHIQQFSRDAFRERMREALRKRLVR